jgi:hypothetical protein
MDARPSTYSDNAHPRRSPVERAGAGPIVGRTITAMLRRNGAIVLPPTCLACRLPVTSERTLCPTCWAGIRFIERPFCERLGAPSPSQRDLHDAIVYFEPCATDAEIAAERSGAAFDVLLRRNIVTGATVALRRSLLDQLLPVPEGWHHDEWLAIGASLLASVDCLQGPSIRYRQHERNQLGFRRRNLLDKISASRCRKRDYMSALATRLEQLLLHVQRMNIPLSEGQQREIEVRIAHARFRSALPPNLWTRLQVVIREAMSGRYSRYSSGLHSIASDIADLR